MLTPTNIWMSVLGVAYFAAGVIVLRKEIGAACGIDKLIALASVFIAASLAAFAPEHFRGPEFVKGMVPSWMPGHAIWAYVVGCALITAATSLTLRKLERLSATMLGLMFFLFVCLIYIPSAIENYSDRLAWALLLRDLSFAAGCWALAGVYRRDSSPQLSRWMILFARVVLSIAAIVFAAQHLMHPEFAPGVPLEKITPAWVPLARLWGYLAGAILLVAGTCLALNKQSRRAAATIGALMTALTLFFYLPILIHSLGGSPDDINDGINYVADTLLYAGAALALAMALPRDSAAAGEP